jgi:hypothetical protein
VVKTGFATENHQLEGVILLISTECKKVFITNPLNLEEQNSFKIIGT